MACADPEEELECLVCMNLYNDPVTMSCGHNFCWICINRILNTQDRSGVYSCPECAEEFEERPALQKNPTLCKLVENFLSLHLEGVDGTYCTYIDLEEMVVKSCELCEASLCEEHLRVHSKAPQHVLTDLRTTPEDRSCAVHDEILGYYRTEDMTCTCSLDGELRNDQGSSVRELRDDQGSSVRELRDDQGSSVRELRDDQGSSVRELRDDQGSSVRELRNDQGSSVRELRDDQGSSVRELRGDQEQMGHEASEKKQKLKDFLQKVSTKREKTEERVQSLEEHRRKAEEAQKVTTLFTGMRKQLEDLENKALSEISRQKEQVSLSLSVLIQKLEIKKDELSRKIGSIEELCNMTDPLDVLQEPDAGDLCEEEEDEDTGGHDGGHWSVEAIPHISYALSDLTRTVNVTFYSQGPTDMVLDINTAANNIHISDDLKTVTRTQIKQNRPETAKRFQYFQVMSSNSISSGQHYWDVESSGSGKYWVGVCYPSIDRRGSQSYIGYNNKSWSLYVGLGYMNRCLRVHDGEEVMLPHQISATGVRLYVDYEAGQLSFYELCEPIKHLHTFTATFTKPLHAALCIWGGCINISGGKEAVALWDQRRNRRKNW